MICYQVLPPSQLLMNSPGETHELDMTHSWIWAAQWAMPAQWAAVTPVSMLCPQSLPDDLVLIRVSGDTSPAMLQDLIQFKDREKWYAAKFCSDDAPDWNPGSFVSSEHAAPGRKLITVDAEISRDKVPIRNAYKHVGQRATLRVNSGPERDLFGGRATPKCHGCCPWLPSMSSSASRYAESSVHRDLLGTRAPFPPEECLAWWWLELHSCALT